MPTPATHITTTVHSVSIDDKQHAVYIAVPKEPDSPGWPAWSITWDIPDSSSRLSFKPEWDPELGCGKVEKTSSNGYAGDNSAEGLVKIGLFSPASLEILDNIAMSTLPVSLIGNACLVNHMLWICDVLTDAALQNLITEHPDHHVVEAIGAGWGRQMRELSCDSVACMSG